MNENKRLATTILIIIDAVAILVMLFAGIKVYKIDKFKNRFILFMMIFIVLSICFDLANWTVIKMTEPKNDKDFMHGINIGLDLATGTSMIVALLLNLRIWLVYLLKIVFMGKANRQQEAGTSSKDQYRIQENNLRTKINIINAITILWGIVDVLILIIQLT